MDVKTLQPNRSIIKTEGYLSYGESVQGWNTIRLKKELINEFSALKEKSSKFSYTLTFYRTYEELEKALKKIKREKLPLPMLLFLQKISAH